MSKTLDAMMLNVDAFLDELERATQSTVRARIALAEVEATYAATLLTTALLLAAWRC
jgi:hypothetical protein